ncbi:hypothetical protein NF320_004975 [Salmonella enterica]|nr:hypothetical protein [Salmonella enterica]ECS8255173.1 hypothetical protein [Salmonella enterica subsp. enterica serovar Waycross]EAO1689148.1 hypothetical protein [Salmonella enterica]EAP9093609.1 hypothetical protein [Salmonella enterica]EAR8731040.1 hypothetical protein [Salmonella enterica]
MADLNQVTGNICDVATGVCQSLTLSLNTVPVSVVFTRADINESAPYFFMAFFSTMGLWLVAKFSGVILGLIRDW